MSYPIYVGYTIWFTDIGEYAIARLIGGGTTFFINPVDACSFLGITYPVTAHGTYPPINSWTDGVKGIFSNFYSLQSPGTQIFNPVASGINMDPTQDSTLVPDVTGNPPIFVGTVAEFIWYCHIVYLNPVTETNTLNTRRWLGGMEIAAQGEGGGSINFQTGSRASSRTVDGLGIPIVGTQSTGAWLRSYSDYGIANPQFARERLYVRVRGFPSTPSIIWRSQGSISPNIGFVLSIGTAGEFIFSQSNAAGTLVTLATFAASVGVFHVIDLLFSYASSPGQVPYLAYVDFVQRCNGLSVSMAVQTHSSSQLGRLSGSDSTMIVDVDDWVNINDSAVGARYDSFYGTHVRSFKNLSVSGAGWTSTVGQTNQGHDPNQATNANSTSTTSGASLVAVVDMPPEDASQDIGFILGSLSAIISAFSSNSGGTDGKLGINANGLTQNTVIDQNSVAQFNSVLAPLTAGILTPQKFTPMTINHDKSADANTDTLRNLSVIVEQVGYWNACDDGTGTFEEAAQLIHNAYYPNTPWALGGAFIPPPTAPVFAIGGTYVGNGTDLTVNLPAPAHFIWIRGLSGASLGVKWFGSGLGGHGGVTDHVVPSYICRSWVDSTGQAKFMVTGTDPECNAVGVTYQYIVFCDPSMRFNICGAYNLPTGISWPISLLDGNYTPQFGFIQLDKVGIASSVLGLSCAGPGNTAGSGTGMDGTAIASWGAFSKGQLQTGNTTSYATPGQVNYSLWRMFDGFCGYQMLTIGSYVGNGAGGTRAINLTPISGRFPLFVLVQPHNAPAIMRDPSHAGSNSCQVGTLSNTTTGITACAKDQITVGTTLNANLVTYEVFVIWGDTAGMNNGIFYPPGCVPAIGPWNVPVPDPADIAIIGEGGVQLGEDGATLKLSLLRDISGIYTLIDGKTADTLYDRQPATTSQDHAIPNPFFETGYIGG